MSRDFFVHINEENHQHFRDIESYFKRSYRFDTTSVCEDTLKLDRPKLNNLTSSGINSCVIKVLEMDTLDTAKIILAETRNKFLVLNMASDFVPGGGYRKGSLAQEESLFYRTTLSQMIDPKLYPLQPFTALFTPQVLVFRDSNYNVLDYEKCFSIDVLSMAAVRYNKPSDVVVMEQKIHGLCRAARYLGYDSVLLGAFGCGAFHNDPVTTAKQFKTILPQYGFTRVYFAIVGKNNNYKTFKQILE